MKKDKLDKLLKQGVLTKEEYDSFFKTMRENEKGELIGILPNSNALHKYNLNGDLLHGNLLEFLKIRVTPPMEAENMDETFKKYGMMVCGIYDYWYWFTKDNITEEAYKNGRRPIEEATELELGKMIAISERYWEVFYSDCYHDMEQLAILNS